VNTWFTADLHLGHANIIGFVGRPFADVEEMDRTLIANWNAVVGPDDDVWCLGDFCYRAEKAAETYLGQLAGRKHLIWGNHDSDQSRHAKGWATSQPYAEIEIDRRKVVLFHYGQRAWNGMRRKSVMLYGHSHGRLPGYKIAGGGGTLDVGVDAGWNFTPVGLDDILQRIKTFPVMSEAEDLSEGA
jgi:calcineurin-like phosphoesterase family protein